MGMDTWVVLLLLEWVEAVLLLWVNICWGRIFLSSLPLTQTSPSPHFVPRWP